ncbi:MAG TPA: sugar transferase [Acidimicrobiales bacterium]|nr:sugar transferase [Acidimicrobiales bacterium]
MHAPTHLPAAGAKRALDLVLGGLALAGTAPLSAAAAVAIRCSLGSPVLFRQRRAGLGGEAFDLVKFRTMRPAAPGAEDPAFDGERMSKLGRFLRATSVDELPSLWNVLRGDLSLVGPRPLPVRYLDRYDEHQARRHEVRPGLTGWAQVNGRNRLSWPERFELDVWYVDHWTLGLDLRILALTAVRVLRGGGVSHEGHATMPEFTGGDGAAHGR